MKRSVLLLIALICFIACRKPRNINHDTSNTGNTDTSSIDAELADKKIATVHVTSLDGGAYEFTDYSIAYDGLGRVDSMLQVVHDSNSTIRDSTLKKITYYSDYYTVKIIRDGYTAYAQTMKVGINSAGLVTYMTGQDGTNAYNDSIINVRNFYDNKNRLIETIHYNHSFNPYTVDSTISTYSWDDNSNCTQVNNSWSGIVHYIFDLSKQGQTGDFCRIESFLYYGRSYFVNHNVPYADTNAHGFYYFSNFNYAYDSANKMTTFHYGDYYNTGATHGVYRTYSYTYY